MLVCCNKNQSEKKTKCVLNLVPGEERVGFRTRNRKDVTFTKKYKFMSSLINKLVSTFHSDFTFEIDF